MTREDTFVTLHRLSSDFSFECLSIKINRKFFKILGITIVSLHRVPGNGPVPNEYVEAFDHVTSEVCTIAVMSYVANMSSDVM